MNKINLDIILEEGEGYFIEFKETLSKIDKEMVAFANSSGGRIFLGISDSGIIKGFQLNNKLKSEIQNIAENCDPPIRITIQQYQTIAIINVPEGDRKPYKCTSGFYLRIGANSQKMNTDDIIAFIKNEGRVLFDELINYKANFPNDFDLEKYQNYLYACKITNKYEYEDLLMNLGVLIKENNITYLNNVGVLFFTKDPSRFIPQNIITCVLYKGNEKIHILDRKDYANDLISNIEEAILFLKKHLKIKYLIESTQRIEILEIPEVALREAVVNSVVHRDYFEKGSNIYVEIYDDKVEISNPGGLVKGLTELEFGKRSVTRNPLISSLLLRANYIEKLGTGINRIQKSLKEAELPYAEFDITNLFVIRFNRTNIIDKEEVDDFQDAYDFVEDYDISNTFSNKKVNKKRYSRMIHILEFIENYYINSSLELSNQLRKSVGINQESVGINQESVGINQESVGINQESVGINQESVGIDKKSVGINNFISERTLERDLKLLKEFRLIEYVGSKKSGRYKVTKLYLDFKKSLIKKIRE